MHAQRKMNLFPYFLIFLEISLYLSNDMYLPAMPAIAQDLLLSQEQIQYTLTLWFLGASSLQLILGPISDTYGRRGIILLGGVCFAISSAICAIASTLPILLIARFVQGSTICCVLVAGYAAVHEAFNTKTAIKIFAFMNAITIIAPAFGPLVGALIVQFTTWRNIFWLLCLLGAMATFLLFFNMPETNTHKHKLHFKSIIKDYWHIFGNKEYMLPTLGYCLLVSIFFLWMFEAPFLIIVRYGHSNLYYGIAQACIFGCFFVGAELTNKLLNKFNLTLLVRIAMVITLIGTVLLALSAKFYDDMLMSIICMMIISTGASVLFAPTNRIAMEASTQPMGRRTAVFSTTLSLFGAGSGWALTFIEVHSLSAIATLIVICTGLATVAMLMTKIPLVTEPT